MKRRGIIFLLLAFLIIPAVSFAKAHAEGKWWENAVFYQIFPLSFYDSSGSRMGDINGITEKLDYLEYLGITAIWLTPIHPVPAGLYHGYALNDFYAVREELGTMEDFERLIKEAKKRGIYIVMDLVMNHTSTEHKWFVESATKQGSKYADYYIWQKNPLPGWENASGNPRQPPWNKYEGEGYRNGHHFYAAFNFTLPDLNYQNPAVREEMNKIAKFWLDKGVKGFRIDAARYLIETGPGNGQKDTPETIDYLRDFSKYVKSVDPDAYVIGEVYAGMDICKRYYNGYPGMDAVFDFDFGGKGGIIQGAFRTGMTTAFYRTIDSFLNIGKRDNVPLSFFSLYFSNHDSGRMPEVLREAANIKAAAAIFFTMPGGAPYIYYGDEIGMREGPRLVGDAEMRNPMHWDSSQFAGFTTGEGVWTRRMHSYHMDPRRAEGRDKEMAENNNVEYQKNDPQSVLQLYRRMIEVRKKYPALYRGEYEELKIDLDNVKVHTDRTSRRPQNPFVAYIRHYGNQAVLVMVNPGRNRVDINQELGSKVLQNGNWKIIDVVYSQDLTGSLPRRMERDLENKRINGRFEARDFIIVVMEK
jgi:glycosidase